MNEKEIEEIIFQIVNNDIFKEKDSDFKENLLKLLVKDPSIFLEKYAKFLSNSQYEIFQKYYKNDYEVQYYLKKYYKLPEKDQKIRNRRNLFLNKLLKEGDYFSMDEMKKRRPDLYQEYIKEDEKDIIFEKDMKIHERLLENYDYTIMKSKMDQNDEKRVESIDFEQINVDTNKKVLKKEDIIEKIEYEDDYEFDLVVESEIEPLKEDEYQFLNFQSEMKRLFIEGLDKDFDYSQVDNDDSFDDVKQMQQDSEDAYFD